MRGAMPRILLVSFIAAILAYFIARSITPVYQAHFSFLVSLSEREDVAEYSFDGYYALQATDLFTATVAQWIKAPEVIVEAHDYAGMPRGIEDPRILGRAVGAIKTAPQLIEVTVKKGTSKEAMDLAQALQVVMQRNVERYHSQGAMALNFKVVSTEPWLGKRELAVPIIVLATFVFVFVVGINVVLLVESMKRL